jgi:hypothetical protein
MIVLVACDDPHVYAGLPHETRKEGIEALLGDLVD